MMIVKVRSIESALFFLGNIQLLIESVIAKNL